MRGKSFSSLFCLAWRVRTKQESTEFRAEEERWVFMGWIMQRQSKHSASCRGKKGKFRWQQWLCRFTLGTHCVVTDLYQHTRLPPPSPRCGPPSAAPPLSAAAQLSIPGMSRHVCSALPEHFLLPGRKHRVKASSVCEPVRPQRAHLFEAISVFSGGLSVSVKQSDSVGLISQYVNHIAKQSATWCKVRFCLFQLTVFPALTGQGISLSPREAVGVPNTQVFPTISPTPFLSTQPITSQLCTRQANHIETSSGALSQSYLGNRPGFAICFVFSTPVPAPPLPLNPSFILWSPAYSKDPL